MLRGQSDVSDSQQDHRDNTADRGMVGCSCGRVCKLVHDLDILPKKCFELVGNK